MTPLVTVGIPTYKRPAMLRRALASVANQEYRKLEVLVADNDPDGRDAEDVVAAFAGALPNLRLVKHPRNIGAINNFFSLLGAANGKYFMWLADDDEVSPNYVGALVELLERNADAASAAGHWQLMDDEHRGRTMPTSSFQQRSALLRSLRFIWRSDDAFFYALHRTDLLRRASFGGYAWPNRNVLLNWAYVYLLDMVLSGRILLAPDPSVRFINHDYTEKDYARTMPAWRASLMHLCRRANVHYLYWEKCARALSPVALPLVIATSLAAMLREGSQGAVRRLARAGGATPA